MNTITRYRLAIALLLSSAMVGCGGSTSTHVAPPQSETEALQRLGLTVTTGVDSPDATYALGQHIHGWLAITNTGTKTRKLELKAYMDQPGYPTKLMTFSGWETPYSLYLEPTDTSTYTVAAGQTVNVVEVTWDQTDVNGQQVPAGWYDMVLQVENLYVDEKHPWKTDTFQVQGRTHVQVKAGT